MTRRELEHIIRAGAAIVGDSHLVVIGSQAILGQYPDAPAELLAARREKDLAYLRVMLGQSLVDVRLLRERLTQVPDLEATALQRFSNRLQRNLF